MNRKLLEAIADIAYIAGESNYFSGNSRFDIDEFISWASEFEKIHENRDWLEEDYILAITEFASNKFKSLTP
jgi:hypothetical protein